MFSDFWGLAKNVPRLFQHYHGRSVYNTWKLEQVALFFESEKKFALFWIWRDTKHLILQVLLADKPDKGEKFGTIMVKMLTTNREYFNSPTYTTQ